MYNIFEKLNSFFYSDTETNSKKRNGIFNVNNIIENFIGYIDTRIDLIKLEIQNKLKAVMVNAIHFTLLAFVGGMFFLFFNIFMALVLNHFLGSTFWGFGIITLLYLILFVALIIGLDKKIFHKMADSALDNSIYNPDKHNETT